MAGSARLTLLLGSGVGLCVWMFNVLGLVHEVRRAWLLVLVRVVGSWITASAVLVMALWFAGKPPETAAALARAAARSGATTLTLDTAR